MLHRKTIAATAALFGQHFDGAATALRLTKCPSTPTQKEATAKTAQNPGPSSTALHVPPQPPQPRGMKHVVLPEIPTPGNHGHPLGADERKGQDEQLPSKNDKKRDHKASAMTWKAWLWKELQEGFAAAGRQDTGALDPELLHDLQRERGREARAEVHRELPHQHNLGVAARLERIGEGAKEVRLGLRRQKPAIQAHQRRLNLLAKKLELDCQGPDKVDLEHKQLVDAAFRGMKEELLMKRTTTTGNSNPPPAWFDEEDCDEEICTPLSTPEPDEEPSPVFLSPDEEPSCEKAAWRDLRDEADVSKFVKLLAQDGAMKERVKAEMPDVRKHFMAYVVKESRANDYSAAIRAQSRVAGRNLRRISAAVGLENAELFRDLETHNEPQRAHAAVTNGGKFSNGRTSGQSSPDSNAAAPM